MSVVTTVIARLVPSPFSLTRGDREVARALLRGFSLGQGADSGSSLSPLQLAVAGTGPPPDREFIIAF